ncbi:MAG: putative metal-binding motif-containing protein [Sandaracinaceae bacterium]|nr:putative metal-binding motif-containing protein [Sandaracinaceae bacterium]
MSRRIASVLTLLALGGCGLSADFAPPRRDASAAGMDAASDAASPDAAPDADLDAGPRPDAWSDPRFDAAIDAQEQPVDGFREDTHLDAPATDAWSGDAGLDPACTTAIDGEPCGDFPPQLCVSGRCVVAGCGDGFVGAGEACEPVMHPACDPRTCQWPCNDDFGCPGTDCTRGTCMDHLCHYENVVGSCTFAADTGTTTGVCVAGLCSPVHCGDGIVETATGELCDPPGLGCTGCRFDCATNEDCQNGDPCDGREVCRPITDAGGRVTGRVCEADPASIPCTAGPCFAPTCVPMSSDAPRCGQVLVGDDDHDGFVEGMTCGSFGGDCDDTDPRRHPGLPEICANGIDDDCNPATADGAGAIVRWCRDADGDHFGDRLVTMESCSAPGPDWVLDCSDCLDTNELVNPGQTSYFAAPYLDASGTESFDYDCRNGEERELDGTVSCDALIRLGCNSSAGWLDAVPGCGEEGSWATCNGVLFLFCRANVATRTQGCR